jgi:membrane fusion protein, multidrug efflux system
VERTGVEFGDRITAGQELALIDTDSYQALVQQAEARMAQARAGEVSAVRELRRQEELRNTGIASPADYDAAVAAADQAKAAVAAAQAALVIARLNLDRSRIQAPFDAAVAERIASAGDFVRVGSPLFRIVNDSVLKFIVQAPEAFAPLVRKEQPVVFTVDAYPGRTFEGKVFLISPQVNMTTRMFDFGALVPNADRALKASTFARGELILERAVPTPMIPLEAVVVSSGVARVFVVTNGVAESRRVRLGRIHEGRQEVLEGIVAGEEIVTSGHSKLRPGGRVTRRS